MKTTSLAAVMLVTSIVAASNARADEREDFFETRIRPVLVNACFRCHGDLKTSGTLRVDSREALLKGGDSGAAIVPGKPDESVLIRAIRREADVSAMPPEKDKALRPDQIDAFVTWIKNGAVWPAKTAKFEATKHWAFEPIRSAAPPEIQDKAWAKTNIDFFIRAKQEAAGVRPAPFSDKRTLIRRAAFDLTGLPPTPEEIAAFESDSSQQAFESVVNRLLKSPHYGEHWGRHWLDLVRYADTAGENSDHPLPHAWRYRNWVIRAFNDNKPYDEFLREQIAGDLLASDGPPEKFADRVIATGYLAIARRFGHDIDKDMHLTLEDTIDTLGKSVLGLTLGCTRCHDHKYDPLTSRDYYGLYGILESTKFSFPGCEPKQQPRDLVPLMPPDEFARTVKPLQDRAAALDSEIKRLSDANAVSARTLKEAARKTVTVLSSGEVADASSQALALTAPVASGVNVKRGDVIQLSITPRTNHGADSTLVEFSIAEVGGKNRLWSVADLIDDLPAGNPHEDKQGNAATWCFLDARDSYSFLPESLDAIDGRRELKAWRNGDTPSVFVNTSDQPVKVWTTLPPKSFFMHPGPNGPVAVAWLCPFDGMVKINGRIADAHPGGDGVGWVLEQFASPDIAAAFAKSGGELRALQATQRQRGELSSQIAVPVAYAVMEGEPKNARQHKRGEPTNLGDEMPRKFLDVLGGQAVQDSKTSGRRELSEWLTSSTNPLTARVFVNRVWQWHFGRGLVNTPNDFGTRGTPPTHPELLDHLATEFVRSGWDVKALHRRIMLSATYQTASTHRSIPTSRQDFDFYDTFRRRRLTAEELRDALLTVSGELDRIPGEAHPFPPESTWSFSQHAPFAAEYDTLKRSVYVMQKRNRRIRFFALFDGSDPNASTPQRDVTTVPTQALFFLNDPFLHARAERFATNLLSAAKTDRERLDIAMRTLFGRPATDADMTELTEFLRDESVAGTDQPEDKRLVRVWAAFSRVLLSSNEFLYVD